MRGKATAVIASGILTRITPAHAGKRCTLYPPQANRRDHPRTCGEKRSAARLRIVVLGSPPHMRGKVYIVKAVRLGERITPAHAGKRSKYVDICSALYGSPPHMRGKVSHIATIALYTGITPAHAGKSYDERYEKSLGKDHPRTCGEKASCLCIFALSLGSPPHMRGKVHTLIVLYDNHGITPAHAGKSRA